MKYLVSETSDGLAALPKGSQYSFNINSLNPTEKTAAPHHLGTAQ